jgi:hypothetical protein
MAAGNTWAISSIVAAVVASPAIVIGSNGARGNIDMDEGVATGVLVGGIVVGVGGIVMCVVSDAEYAAGGEAYNEHLKATGRAEGGENAYEDAESLE